MDAETKEESFAYVGFTECGCMVAACVDRPEWKKDTAKFLAQMARDGLRIERVSCERVRVELSECKCGQVKQGELFQ